MAHDLHWSSVLMHIASLVDCRINNYIYFRFSVLLQVNPVRCNTTCINIQHYNCYFSSSSIRCCVLSDKNYCIRSYCKDERILCQLKSLSILLNILESGFWHSIVFAFGIRIFYFFSIRFIYQVFKNISWTSLLYLMIIMPFLTTVDDKLFVSKRLH
jgi:hypothetical protein